jgi:hypothetical protein
MMSLKVYVNMKVRLVIDMDEGVELSSVIDDLNYDFDTGIRDDAGIVDTEILDYEVVDSK